MDKAAVFSVLKGISNPAGKSNLVDDNRIHEFNIYGNEIISFSIDATGLSGEQKGSLNQEVQQVLESAFPEAKIHLHFMTPKTSTPKQETPTAPAHNIIAVASGKGGVGKSTVSVNLALSLQKQGFKVGLMDADLYGPSIPTMLNLQGEKPRVRDVGGKPKIVPLNFHGMPVISIGFVIDPEQAVVLRGPRLSGIIKQFIGDCLWPELDYLVIDLPPGTGDIQLTLVQTVALTGVVLVTTPQKVAVADAIKAMNMFRLESVNVPILGVVENMSWFTPAELPDHKYRLFGEGGGEELAKASQTELLNQIPLVQDVREACDIGEPVVKANHDTSKYFDVIANKLQEAITKAPKTKSVEITTR